MDSWDIAASLVYLAYGAEGTNIDKKRVVSIVGAVDYLKWQADNPLNMDCFKKAYEVLELVAEKNPALPF